MNNRKHENTEANFETDDGLKERGDLHTELFLASSNKRRFIFDSVMKQAKCLEGISFVYQLNKLQEKTAALLLPEMR
jgi:hypothetical protein